MKEREKIIVSGLVTFLALLWLGFLLHSDPDFPGSVWGLAAGVAGSVLMLVPLLYLVIKRVKPLKKLVTSKVPMRRLLTWHIYAGVLGPVLVVLHTGHKFESTIGIALTAMTLVVVFSGFVGRYLMSIVGREIRDKRAMLDELRSDYELLVDRLRARDGVAFAAPTGFLQTAALKFARPLFRSENISDEAQALRLSEAIADVEYALRTHQTFKGVFSKWLKIHIAISLLLYALMALHVYAEFFYGLRLLS